MRRTKDITKQCKYKNCKYRHLPYKRFCQKHWDISTSQYLDINMPEKKLIKEIDTRVNESIAYQSLKGEAGFTTLKYDKGRPWTFWERVKRFIFTQP
jgi:hypothetical protein